MSSPFSSSASTMHARRPCHRLWPSASSSTRRRAGDPRSPRTLSLSVRGPWKRPVPSRPFPSPSSAHVEPTRAELIAPAISSPPRSNPSHQSLPRLALCLLHSIPSSAAPKPGRNRARRPPTTIAAQRAPPLSVEPPPPIHLRPNRELHKLPHALLPIPGLFPTRIRRHHHRFAAALPQTLCAPRARCGTALRQLAGHRRAPQRRLASLRVAPLPPAVALLRRSRNGPTTAASRRRSWPCAPPPPRSTSFHHCLGRGCSGLCA
jgi:hypothetical protein